MKAQASTFIQIEKVIQEFKTQLHMAPLSGIAEETEITQTAAAMIIMALIEENVLSNKTKPTYGQ